MTRCSMFEYMNARREANWFRDSELTPRQIRSDVEKRLDFETGTLDTKELKDVVKEATNEAMVCF